MSVEIRACTKDEMADFRGVSFYVFGNNEDDPAREEGSLVLPEWSTCAFVDGRLASILGAFPFRMRFNGAAADTAGLTAVGTLPQYRRRGLLRRTITQSFREQRERGQSLAILWASFGAIYQRFGYGPATSVISYDFDPRWAGLHPSFASEGGIELSQDRDEALPTLKKLYRSYAEPRNCMLHRAPVMWHFGVLMALEKKRRTHIATFRNPDGEPRGYLIYQVENSEQPEGGMRLSIRDFIALDMNAWVGLWNYVLAHDLVARVQASSMPPDDPAPIAVEESRRLGRRASDGLYLRVVDVERALPQRPYGEPGEIVLEIRGDELCDWNNGSYRLVSEGPGGSAEVTRCTAVPDLTMPSRSLAVLVSGHSSASELARARLLDAKDDGVLGRADRMFATRYPPYCPDGF